MFVQYPMKLPPSPAGLKSTKLPNAQYLRTYLPTIRECRVEFQTSNLCERYVRGMEWYSSAPLPPSRRGRSSTAPPLANYSFPRGTYHPLNMVINQVDYRRRALGVVGSRTPRIVLSRLARSEQSEGFVAAARTRFNDDLSFFGGEHGG